MSLSISASMNHASSFTLIDSNGNRSISIADAGSAGSSYTYGNGNNQVTNAVAVTGLLGSGLSSQIDLYALNQATFGSNQTIQFTGIKNISIYNTSSTEGYDFLIAATGSNACTNLFNGGSGNLKVKPYSSFLYNDPYTGFVVSSSQRYLYINDIGSGCTYKITVLGLD